MVAKNAIDGSLLSTGRTAVVDSIFMSVSSCSARIAPTPTNSSSVTKSASYFFMLIIICSYFVLVNIMIRSLESNDRRRGLALKLVMELSMTKPI